MRDEDEIAKRSGFQKEETAREMERETETEKETETRRDETRAVRRGRRDDAGERAPRGDPKAGSPVLGARRPRVEPKPARAAGAKRHPGRASEE